MIKGDDQPPFAGPAERRMPVVRDDLAKVFGLVVSLQLPLENALHCATV
jgi:hypothetical protein